jgi:thymidine kinase
MAKLYFRYGAVGAAKTMNLLAVAHNYKQQNKRALVMKPRLDDRFGASQVKSRAGLQTNADLLLESESKIPESLLYGVQCVLVDEAQFLSQSVIDELCRIAHSLNIPVICYGLRTDFRRNLFEGSKRLMELADAVEEIKCTCAFCNKKAIYNLKLLDGRATLQGPTVELGAEEKYLPVCGGCYTAKLSEAHEGCRTQGSVSVPEMAGSQA